MDYSRMIDLILLDYIQNEGPSEEEIDAFHLGMIRLVNEIDTGTLMNNDIPYMKSDIIRVSNQLEESNNRINELTIQLDSEIQTSKSLRSKLTEFMQLSPEERTKLRKEEEYKNLNELITKVRQQKTALKEEIGIWMSRYYTLKKQCAEAV